MWPLTLPETPPWKLKNSPGTYSWKRGHAEVGAVRTDLQQTNRHRITSREGGLTGGFCIHRPLCYILLRLSFREQKRKGFPGPEQSPLFSCSLPSFSLTLKASLLCIQQLLLTSVPSWFHSRRAPLSSPQPAKPTNFSVLRSFSPFCTRAAGCGAALLGKIQERHRCQFRCLLWSRLRCCS